MIRHPYPPEQPEPELASQAAQYLRKGPTKVLASQCRHRSVRVGSDKLRLARVEDAAIAWHSMYAWLKTEPPARGADLKGKICASPLDRSNRATK